MKANPIKYLENWCNNFYYRSALLCCIWV